MKKCCQVEDKKTKSEFKKWSARLIYGIVSFTLIFLALNQVLNF
ncbi:hypothetical protein BC962_0022 [Gillisia mitskevichiae]|uniref:Uncharacterized protein n=1 Tax=Gillisia mitskevichiae TaxID=270921 RepID=A0A495PWS9_9FLAO|nr:hypothetical protein BC962_0022 [Gillisia mitskevichiae]